jgi:hypothetical protein
VDELDEFAEDEASEYGDSTTDDAEAREERAAMVAARKKKDGNKRRIATDKKKKGNKRRPSVQLKSKRDAPPEWSVLADLKIEPKSVVIAPFEKKVITITYIPSRPVAERNDNVRVSLTSIYSNFDIPLTLVAGTADLLLEPAVFDFGHFEKGKPQERIIRFSNKGSMAFSFRVKRATLGFFPFKLSRWEATLPPGQTVDIACTYLHRWQQQQQQQQQGAAGEPPALGRFCEELVVETDLVGSMVLVNVSGLCDESALDATEFAQVRLGHCTVGETCSRVVTVTNKGGFPADLKLTASYPLKATPKTLAVPGHGHASFTVSWRPMGGYELRAAVRLTGDGLSYVSNVSGVGVYPRFTLGGADLDFGVCAPGASYERSFAIKNTGRVPMDWTIPAVAEGYSVSQQQGVLAMREETIVLVRFAPPEIGRFPGDFIVESRGRYKIVACTGIGGVLDVISEPADGLVDLGETPVGCFSERTVVLSNRGGVTVQLVWHGPELAIGATTELRVLAPPQFRRGEACELVPGERLAVVIAVRPTVPGAHFSLNAAIECHEQRFPVELRGVGHAIALGRQSRALLASEELPALRVPNPLDVADSNERGGWEAQAQPQAQPQPYGRGQERNPTLDLILTLVALEPERANGFLRQLEHQISLDWADLGTVLLPPLPVLDVAGAGTGGTAVSDSRLSASASDGQALEVLPVPMLLHARVESPT